MLSGGLENKDHTGVLLGTRELPIMVGVEDDWTNALGIALRTSAAARAGFSRLCGAIGVYVEEGWSFQAPRQALARPGGGSPDLLALDEQRRPRLAVEVKFGAGLTPKQPTGYLAGLPVEVPSGVLFIVSAKQIARVTAEVASRLSDAGLVGAGDWGSLLRFDGDGSRGLELSGGQRVALVTDDALVRALERTDTPPELLEPLRSIGSELGQRWHGGFADVDRLLQVGTVVQALAEQLGVGVLCDWPYAGSQRLHMLYRPEWCPPQARLPSCAVALGWHWGTRLDGGTTGNDGVRPYVTVAVLDPRARASLRLGLTASSTPGGRRLERPSPTYPAWFYLAGTHKTFEAGARRALVEAWRAWKAALDSALKP